MPHFEGSLMRKMQDYIVQSKEVFIGLEDSKKHGKLRYAVRRVF